MCYQNGIYRGAVVSGLLHYSFIFVSYLSNELFGMIRKNTYYIERTSAMKTLYFERSEGKLAYSDSGNDGQPVIMLPGMGALRSEYRFLVPRLTEAGFRAVTVDLRGQGESSIPWESYDVSSVGNDILYLIEHLHAGPAHVIGTSFSPSAVIWAATERPDNIRSLVLISPFVRDVKINRFMLALFWLMMNNPWRVQAWTKYYGTMYPAQKPSDFQDYLRELKTNLKEPGRFNAVKAFGSASRKASEERLNQIKKPTLVIVGSKDPDFPDPEAEGRIIANKTNGTLVLIEEAGHYPQTEMPDETASHIIKFLKKIRTPE
jgi:pimeloyl-ACP methyl ester carboxylesterase